MQKSRKTAYDSSFVPQTNVHIGQRKLLLSEIQLLTKWYKKYSVHPIVLYVGAAPGTHLLTLSSMFPSAYFVLYDGARFDQALYRYPNIFELHGGRDGFVDTQTIHKIKERFKNFDNLILISDIRLGSEDRNAFETGVTEDMRSQLDWMKILKPKMSLLKFRMSYHMKHGEKLKYNKGTLLYQVWPKGTSGEARLLAEQQDVGKIVDYDFKEYEETMFFHNKYERPFCFSDIPQSIKKHVYAESNSYCPCYDCLSELTVLSNYAAYANKPLDATIKMFATHTNRERVPVFQNKGLKLPVPPLQSVSL